MEGWEKSRLDVLVKKTARLCHHPALVTAHAMYGLDVVEVFYDVVLANTGRRYIVVVAKQIPHLRNIIADGAGRIMLGRKEVRKPDQKCLCFGVEGNFAQDVFFVSCIIICLGTYKFIHYC